MYNEAEALESMDEITRQAVKRLGFKNLCLSESQMTDRANFRMIYEQVAERKKKEAQLPESLRLELNKIKMIDGVNNENKIQTTICQLNETPRETANA